LAYPGVATTPRSKQAAAPPRDLSTPPNENMKIHLWFSVIVYNRIILYLCTSTPKYFIYYFVYPNQWSSGNIFAKHSRMLLILAMLPWQLSGPAYFHMHDRLCKRVENDFV
jgi:hypothetical protein